MTTAPIEVLSISNLYPNNVKPTFGIFVKNRLVELANTKEVDIRVIAPVPFFPGLRLISSDYAASAQIDKEAERRGIKVYYQRYLHIPKIGMFFQPFFMLMALVIAQWKLKKQGWCPQIIDSHFYYPDGFAAVMLGKYVGIPAVVSARGVESRVVFIGRLGQSDLITQYQNAAILVLASEKEGWPNVVLEALACGTPVVATPVGGVPEIITNGPVARLVDRSPKQIAGTIKQLLKEMPTAKQCREHAEMFTWQATTQGILHLYKNIVGGS